MRRVDKTDCCHDLFYKLLFADKYCTYVRFSTLLYAYEVLLVGFFFAKRS